MINDIVSSVFMVASDLNLDLMFNYMNRSGFQLSFFYDTIQMSFHRDELKLLPRYILINLVMGNL